LDVDGFFFELMKTREFTIAADANMASKVNKRTRLFSGNMA
jgi:hypothetical protein